LAQPLLIIIIPQLFHIVTNYNILYSLPALERSVLQYTSFYVIVKLPDDGHSS